ncbi:histidine phosphatase family protein [Skermanella stibiiresistens]|uniref:histidine phosphatase family protein n=1 Tax=Skermanella stibiiresistens TaxID=913326 RepID=UPI001FE1B9B8|nr:histidine phosphatase family protein [Skermanella stibiiresistens]
MLLALFVAVVSSTPARADESAAWAALRDGGNVILMRHATTVPGIGDPPGFRLDDCATQRVLSDAGREQATRIGAVLAERGMRAGRVLTSAWCRCVDTATLMDVGPVVRFEPLNSFFESSGEEKRQSAAVREAMAGWTGPGTLVMVTHQVNVTALTGVVPASGEIVVARPDGTVVGRIKPPS